MNYNTKEINRKTQAQQVSAEMRNAFWNYDWIKCLWGKSMKSIQKNTISGPAIVCGSGSSLNEFLPVAREWDGPIFCTASQYLPLVDAGAKYIFCIALDVNTSAEQFGQASSWPDTANNTLIAHPGISREVFSSWAGPVLLYRCRDLNTPAYEYLADAYDFINFELYLFSSSIPAMITIAQYMGASPIFLTGCDFSAKRFDGNTNAAPEGELVKIGGKETTALQAFYLRSAVMSILIGASPAIVSSRDSLLADLVPTVGSISNVVKKRGKGYERRIKSQKELSVLLEIWLASQNMYYCRYRRDGSRYGYQFVEATGVTEVIKHMLMAGASKEDRDRMAAHVLWLGGITKASPFIDELV